jgi:hypothetical protein
MDKKKKSYQKPKIARIDLKSEEIFLTSCKLASGSLSTRARAFRCSASTRCSTITGAS